MAKDKEKKPDDNLLEILGKKFKLPEFKEDVIDLSFYTKMDSNDIESQLESLPFELQIFGITQAKALKNLRRTETVYKIWRASKDSEIRRDKTKKAEKFTEKQLENEIITDPEYKIIKNKLHSAEEKYEQLKSVYWAIQKKSDVLIEMSKQNSKLKQLKNSRIDQ